MSFNLLTPLDLIPKIAQRAKEKRLTLNLSQQSLAERSGVSLSVIKKFERTGKISVESLLKIAFILESLEEFDRLFLPKPLESYKTLNELLQQRPRKRGRR